MAQPLDLRVVHWTLTREPEEAKQLPATKSAALDGLTLLFKALVLMLA